MASKLALFAQVQHCGRGGRLIAAAGVFRMAAREIICQVDGLPVSDNQAIALYNGARIIFGRAFAFRLALASAMAQVSRLR